MTDDVLEAEATSEAEIASDPPSNPPSEPEPEPDAPSQPEVPPQPEAIAAPIPITAPIPISIEPIPISIAPIPLEPDPPLEPRTVGRAIADALRVAGVRYAFTVPGESFLGLLDGLQAADIRVVATRHEGAAAFMAEAHGQLTGRPAACIGTRAVGAANLSIGIHTARQDSTPMFSIVGQVDRPNLGREAFQEVDQVGSFGRLAKWSAELTDPARTGLVMTEALAQALGGRPGPVHLSIPEDVLDELVPDDDGGTPSRPTRARATDEEVRAVLQMLAAAHRPVILAGGGVLSARASNELLRVAELLDVPIIAAWRRGDVISNDHPLYLGMTGYGAPPTVRARLERADAILVLGCRLSEIASFGYAIPADGTRWAHVDADPRRAGADARQADIAVTSDAKAFLKTAIGRLGAAALEASAVDARRAANLDDRVAWEASTTVDDHPWSGPGVHPGRIVTTLRAVLPDEAIITTDAGSFGTWFARGYRFRKPGTFLGPTSGAMGYGLPAAIAAALVHRDRPVVAVVGDGGLAMTMAELETAVREKARVVVLAFDNESYGMIRSYQDRRPAEPVATDLGPIDFAAVARACGAHGVLVETDDSFEPALRQALADDLPTVIHLRFDRAWTSVDARP